VSKNISFHAAIQLHDPPKLLLTNFCSGVHTGGHFTIGGDPGGDIFTSPGDPAFFLHHAQIDRTWWIWQNQDLKNRQNAIAGTITLNNSPPSRNGTLQDYISLGVNAVDITIGSAMNTLAGPFCYIYV
jgi:tyrosinase